MAGRGVPPVAGHAPGAVPPRRAGGYSTGVPAQAGSPQAQITVTLKQLNGKADRVMIPMDANVAALKQLAFQRTGILVEQQKLVCAGRLLDDSNVLCEVSVVDGATVMLVMRNLPGKPRPSPQAMLDTYEITICQQRHLEMLRRYDICFLADDSGSMNVHETTAGVTQSRWQELKTTMSTLIDFASYFDADGTDIYFLNREGIEKVTDGKDPRIKPLFAKRASGTTPLAARLRWVVDSRPEPQKPLLLIVATDGQPDEGVPAMVATARHCLTLPGRDVRLAILACTQDNRAVAWLNQLDTDQVIGDKVDVTDDYESEKKEVMATGRTKQFLLSDYLVKAMLGPICDEYDKADER